MKFFQNCALLHERWAVGGGRWAVGGGQALVVTFAVVCQTQCCCCWCSTCNDLRNRLLANDAADGIFVVFLLSFLFNSLLLMLFLAKN